MFDGQHPDDFTPLPQTRAYALASAALGAQAVWTEAGLMLVRPGLRLISRGQGDAAVLRRLARFAGVLVVTPEQAMRGFGLIPVVTPVHHAVWDLGCSGGCDLRAGMAGKWRNRLVAAERAGVRVSPGRAGAWEGLVAQEAAQRAPRGYRALPVAFSLGLAPQVRRVWEWRQAKAVQAAMGFVVEGATATYHLGWAAPAARAQGVHGVMLWQAAVALRAEGVRWLDLGSVSDAAPGLAHFKQGTGAKVRPLGATMLVLPG